MSWRIALQKVLAVIAITLSVQLLTVVEAADKQSNEAAQELARIKTEYADVLALQGTARKEILTIARLLRANPEMAIDRTQASGEYCLKSGLGTMVHYATDPEKTKEDIVYEFDASQFIKAGLKPENLPKLPPLGQMKPGQWYYLPPGEIDPHHQHPMPGATVLIAVDVY